MTDLEAMTLAELKQHIEDAQKLFVRKKAEEAENLKARLADIAQENGFDIGELFNPTEKPKKAKAEPKFRDPDNPENTWAGRGAKPKWLRDAIEAGRSQDDFKI